MILYLPCRTKYIAGRESMTDEIKIPNSNLQDELISYLPIIDEIGSLIEY